MKYSEQEAAESKQFQALLRRNILLPLIMCILMGGTFVYLINSLLNASALVSQSDRIISEATQLLKSAVDAETGLRGYLLTGTENFLEPQIRSRSERGPLLARLRELVNENPDQLNRLNQVAAQLEVWVAYCDEMKEKRAKRAADYADYQHSLRGKLIMDRVRDLVASFIQAADEIKRKRTEATQESVRVILAATILASLILGFLLALFGRRQLLTLSSRFNSSLTELRRQSKIIEERGRLQEGISGVGDAIRGNLSVTEVCDNAISFLARYIDSPVGRLFVVNPMGDLVSAGTYAFDASKSDSRTSYSIGQGLVGQCAKEGKSIRITEVPTGYMEQSSSLGGAPVHEILLVPAVAEGSVAAVLELGFQQTPSELTLAILEQACDRIAHSIRSAQYRRQTQDLLEETQRQSEELQSQQEELESNNEDLQQKSHELLAQQHNLEQANSELEQQQTMLEEQKERLEQANQELMRAEADIKIKAQNLETASRYKSEFLANMSHELRTPLNSILLLSNLLTENSKQSLDAEDIEYSSTIHSAATDLLNLINDILDLSKVEAGKLDISPEKTPLTSIADTVRRLFSPQMEKKGLQFSVEVDPKLPPDIITDKVRTDQVLRNFLSNALKFTEHGSVKVLFQKPAANSAYALDISVSDTGIGIPVDKQGLIFEAFHQADGTISRKFGGTGLGLTISRELARLLGGRITVESKEGKGSIFILSLPRELRIEFPAVPPASIPRQRESAGRDEYRPSMDNSQAKTAGMHLVHGIEDDRRTLKPGERVILVVEDDPKFAEQLFKLIKRKGHKCLLASEGEQGLSDAITYQPLGIVLDVNLPGISGLGVLDSLKRNSRTRHIPVHVVSVEPQRGKEVLHMGAAGFDTKPVTMKGLEVSH